MAAYGRGALGVGRLQLAMLAQDLAVGGDEQQRAVHRAGRNRIELGDSDGDIAAGFARRRAQLVGLRTGYPYRGTGGLVLFERPQVEPGEGPEDRDGHRQQDRERQ